MPRGFHSTHNRPIPILYCTFTGHRHLLTFHATLSQTKPCSSVSSECVPHGAHPHDTHTHTHARTQRVLYDYLPATDGRNTLCKLEIIKKAIIIKNRKTHSFPTTYHISVHRYDINIFDTFRPLFRSATYAHVSSPRLLTLSLSRSLFYCQTVNIIIYQL